MGLTLEATCGTCGSHVAVMPPNLPHSGGYATFHDDPSGGWEVLEFVCGSCWAKRPRSWPCGQCGGTGPVWGNFCSSCHALRPDPVPYVPDWDLIGKEARERKREAEALAAEWDRKYPGWRTAGLRRREWEYAAQRFPPRQARV